VTVDGRDVAMRTRLKELAAQRMRFGYQRLTAMFGTGRAADEPSPAFALSSNEAHTNCPHSREGIFALFL